MVTSILALIYVLALTEYKGSSDNSCPTAVVMGNAGCCSASRTIPIRISRDIVRCAASCTRGNVPRGSNRTGFGESLKAPCTIVRSSDMIMLVSGR